MTRRLYAAGVAALVMLLLSTAVGAEPSWVDIGGTVHEAAPQALKAPAGATAISTVAAQVTPPEQPLADGMPPYYVYLGDNSTGANFIPWWGESQTAMRVQYLYLASEINKSGTIAQAGLFKNYWAGYYNTFNNTSVKLCQTSVTALTNNFTNNYGGNNPVWVYHGDLYRGMPAAGYYDTLDLTTPFVYNGTDNLVIEVLWSGRTSAVEIPSYTGWLSSRRAYLAGDTASNTATGVDAAINSTRLQFLDVGEATIDLVPNKLKLDKPKKWLKCYVELPEGLSVGDIALNTVAISAIDGVPLAHPLYQTGSTAIDDYDLDLIPDLMVEFSQQELAGILIAMGYGDGDEPVLTVTGILPGIATFKGSDVIKLSEGKGGGQGSAPADLPKSFSMQLGSPLPSRGIVVQYALPAAGNVSLKLYDVSGALAKTVTCGYVLPGNHAVSLSRQGLARGAYILKFESGAGSLTRKLVIE